MRAVTFQGAKDIQVKHVEDPSIRPRMILSSASPLQPFAVPIFIYT